MKTHTPAIFLSFFFGGAVVAAVPDPVIDYKIENSLVPADVLYKWSADIDGDDNLEVFLELKESYEEDLQNQQVPSWTVYIATLVDEAVKYNKSTEIDFGEPEGISSTFPKIDPTKVFVGQITQLGKRGLVTMQRDITKKGIVSTRIFAYTIENSKLKETTLVQYYGEEPNAVQDQYLADNVRTQIQLVEVVP